MGDRVAVGRINSPWGLRGHVRVTPLTSNPDRLQAGSELIVLGARRRVLEHVAPQGYPILLIEGYEDRTRAEALRGALLEIDEAELPALPPGEHYVHDLLGLTVETVDGEAIGELVDVLATGANDAYVVRREGRRDALIPAIPDVVREVDLERGVMRISPLDGLLD